MQKVKQAPGAWLERRALLLLQQQIGGAGTGLRIETEAHDTVAPELEQLEHLSEFGIDVRLALGIRGPVVQAVVDAPQGRG